MLTLNTILKAMKGVTLTRMEEPYQFIHTLTQPKIKTETLRKKILSFGGAFNSMDKKDYAEFRKHTKKIRDQLFDRGINL